MEKTPQLPKPLTEAEKHQEILGNLELVLARTSFQPAEFKPAVEMIEFVAFLKAQADARVAAERPPAPAPRKPRGRRP